MWPLFVVVTDPAADPRLRLAQRFESVLPDALYLQGPEEALDQSILLRAIGHRVLLDEPLDFHRRRIASTTEVETVVRTQCPR